jgi:hypothetical protein
MDLYFKRCEAPRPQDGHVRSTANWMNGNQPLAAAESKIFDDHNDLVAPACEADESGLEDIVTWLATLLMSTRLANVTLSFHCWHDGD